MAIDMKTPFVISVIFLGVASYCCAEESTQDHMVAEIRGLITINKIRKNDSKSDVSKIQHLVMNGCTLATANANDFAGLDDDYEKKLREATTRLIAVSYNLAREKMVQELQQILLLSQLLMASSMQHALKGEFDNKKGWEYIDAINLLAKNMDETTAVQYRASKFDAIN